MSRPLVFFPQPDDYQPSSLIEYPSSKQIWDALDAETRKWVADKIGGETFLKLTIEYSYNSKFGECYRDMVFFYFETEDHKICIYGDHTEEGPLILLEREIDGENVYDAERCLRETVDNLYQIALNFHEKYG